MSARDSIPCTPMTVTAVTSDAFTNRPLAILHDATRRHSIAVVIDSPAAAAIAAQIAHVDLLRPTTHQLACDLLALSGARVVKVCVAGLSDDTFETEIALELPGGQIAIQPARPSDALAIAALARVQVEVAAHVVARCGGAMNSGPFHAAEHERCRPDAGRWKM